MEINNIPDNRNSQESLLWDKIAESYVTTSVEENEVELAKEIEKIFNDYGIPIGSKLLEAGCGSGHLSGYLASKGYKTTLLDFSKVALEKAKEYYDKRNLNGDFLFSDIFNLSEKSVGFYDVVWNSGVLEHFDGLQIIEILQKMTMITKELVVILVPNPKCTPYMLFRKKAMERGQWTWGLEILRTSLKDLAEFAGLDIIEERPLGGNFCKSFIDYVNQEHQEQLARKDNHDIDSTQKYLVALIAKPTKRVMALQDKADLLQGIFRKELEALRKTYQFDTSAMAEGLDQNKILQVQKSQIISELQQTKMQLEQDLTSKSNTINHLEQDLKSHAEKIEELEKELSFQRERIHQIYNSKSWKMGQLYAKKFGGTPVGKLGEKIVNHLIKTLDYGVDLPQTMLTKDVYDKVLDDRKQYSKIYKIITDCAESKGIIIYPPTVDWNIPLLQRPQHMAQYLASEGWLYFYCTSNTYDKISGFQQLQHGLYLTDRYTDLVNNLDGFVFVIHSGHPTLTIEDIEKLKGKALIVYDYLDEIHPSVSGLQLQNVYARHKYLIENSDIVLVTADKLLLEVKQLRNKDVYLLSNAVDYEHFHVQKNITTIPGEIKKILGNTKKPIVGYFGALASWVDYDLIRYIATKRSDLEFVLLGWDYDGSLEKSKLLGIKNVHYLGVKEYEKLPNYAIWFDICILPFSLNEVTHATSPIKLFEYMALGKPIISTPIKEALKYNSVIIANDQKQFAEKIDHALNLKDDAHYLELVDNEARANTWEIRFTQLDKILQDMLHKKHFYQKNTLFREIIKIQNEISSSMTESTFYVDAYESEEVNFWSHIPAWIVQDNKDDKAQRCLDIGCGYGTIALLCKKLFNYEIYCIDNNDYLSQSLIKKYDIKFKVNNIELDPFPWNDIKFDIIIFTEVLEHFNFHPLPTLQKIHDLLSENGRVYLSTPDALEWGKTEYYDSLDDIPYHNKETKIIDGHIYQYNEKELTDILDKAGFKILRIDYSKGAIYRHFNLTLVKK